MRQAVAKYDMIKKGDLIAVGVSGGKDSLTLLKALAEMRRFADFSYDIIALTVDNGTVSESDLNTISKFSASLNVKHEIIRTDIAKIVFDMRRENNPCSLCAHMRRGALIDRAVELQCTAVALGHHMNDVAETYIMNIFLAGRAGCFFSCHSLSRIRHTANQTFYICKGAQHIGIFKKICSARSFQNMPRRRDYGKRTH